MRQQDPRPRQPRQPQPPTVPFDPNDPSTWPKATPSNLAQLQAKAGYKPLTGKKPATTPWYKTNPFSDDNRYDLSGKNMYNASGTDLLKGVANVVAGAGDFLVTEPVKSMGRTLSTQNLQTAINPKSTATQRINALGEDALNIISLIPTGKALSQASEPAEQALRNWLYRKSAAGKQQLAKEAREAAYTTAENVARSARLDKLNRIEGDINAEKSLMLSQLKTDSYTRPEWLERTYGGSKYDPDIMRVWHTNQSGEPLPYPLRSMEESARLESRRGSGAGQLFSGGLYNTDGAGVSFTYLDEPFDIKDGFPAGAIDRQYLENYLRLPSSQKVVGFNGGAGLDPLGMSANDINRQIVRKQYDDFMSNVKDVNEPIGEALGKILYADPNLSIKQILDNADSPQAAQAIVDQLPYPMSFRSSSIRVPERIKFKYPVISADGKTWSDVGIATSNDAVFIAGKAAREGSGNQVWSKELRDELQKLAKEWEADRIRLFRQKYPNRDPGFAVNPYEEALKDVMNTANRPKWESISGFHMGGQNYWDMPITRGPAGNITSAFGLPALDISNGRVTPETAGRLSSLVDRFIKKELPNAPQDSVDQIVSRIKNLHNSEDPTRTFESLQQSIQGLGQNELTQLDNNQFTVKEKLWQFLRDNGIEVLPHQGGAMTTGLPHQAFVVNSPEKLPKAEYLPSTFYSLGKMNQSLEANREQQIREFARLLAEVKNPGAGSRALLQDRLKKSAGETMNQAKLSAIKAIMTGNASNSARNR